MRLRLTLLIISIFLATLLFSNTYHSASLNEIPDTLAHAEQKPTFSETRPDSILRLTEDDFREVAQHLGVEVAAIKAVVEIEAGRSHQGFSAPGVPLINFDLTMFRRFAARRGVNLAKYSKSHSTVFSSSRGSQARANQRLKSAKTINAHAAIEGTFWGMFQIGGFNWKKCGASSLEDFVERMSRSERDQLDMFAEFIINAGLQKSLRNKDWATFARGYNGPGYAKRGYHTRMAQAFSRYSKAK